MDLERLKHGESVYLPEKRDVALRRAKDLYFNWQGEADGRITTLMCPKAPNMAMPEVYLECKEFAEERHLRAKQFKGKMSQTE